MNNTHLGPDKAQNGPDYDPVNLMAQVFADIYDFKGPAQDILLSWILRLPGTLSPGEAAKLVVSEIVAKTAEKTPEPSAEGHVLIELLRQTSMHNLEAIKPAGMDRRRGGRSARFKT